MMEALFEIEGRKTTGKVMKLNKKSTWVMFKGKIIKRNNAKHNVVIKGVDDEPKRVVRAER